MATTFAGLGDERFVSLTTFRRSGERDGLEYRLTMVAERLVKRQRRQRVIIRIEPTA